jgi:hypothetical protein
MESVESDPRPDRPWVGLVVAALVGAGLALLCAVLFVENWEGGSGVGGTPCVRPKGEPPKCVVVGNRQSNVEDDLSPMTGSRDEGD